MNIYISYQRGVPTRAHWTLEEAEKTGSQEIVIVELDPIETIVRSYFAFRGYKVPDTVDAALFLTSETGELADEVVQTRSEEWVRNHPQDKGKGLAGEIADVLMMDTAVGMSLEPPVDPLQAMLDKFIAKGYKA